jgi:hypothetical protein
VTRRERDSSAPAIAITFGLKAFTSGKNAASNALADRLSRADSSEDVVDIVAMLDAPLEDVERSWEKSRDVREFAHTES